MSQGGGTDAPLRHQLAVLRRRWPVVILLAVLACATAAWLTDRKPPVYEATAAVLVQPTNPLLVPTAPRNPTALATEIELMQSQVVRDAVRAKLGREPMVTVEVRTLTEVIDINSRSTDPRAAAAEATTYAEVYVELRRNKRVEELVKTTELLRGQLADVDKRLSEVERPLRELDARLGVTSDTRLRPQLEQQRNAVADTIGVQRRTIESQRGALDDQLGRLQQQLGLGSTGGVELVSMATLPTDPVSASPLRNGALGLGGGLVLGLALAFLLDQMDDRLRRKDELEVVVGRPVLGLLPRVARRHHGDGILTLQSPTSPPAEAYRTLRTSLQFMAIERPITCIQVTSATSGEGKTTVVTNLAASFAQAGQRVIILDCDLRRPKVHEAFRLPNDAGFTSVLLEQCKLAEVVTTLADESFLAVVTAGPIPPNPSELLSSDRARMILATLRENCDILLIDSPPVLPVTDALVVSRHVDATLLVARSRRSTKRQLARTQELLNQVGAPLVGTVLNGVVHESGDGYGYGYAGYGSKPDRPARGPREVMPAQHGTQPDPLKIEDVRS